MSTPLDHLPVDASTKGGLDDCFAIGASVDAGNPAIFAMVAAILVGMTGGALQGMVVTRLKVSSFVVTLGRLTAFRGAALLFCEGCPISGIAPDYAWWGQGKIGIVPMPVIILIGFAIIAQIVLK